MQYCGPRALPHSQFLSWSYLDQDKALAWMRHEQLKCAHCGTFPEDWLTSDGRPRTPPPFETDDTTCLGCQQIGRYRKFLGDEADSPGKYIVLKVADPLEYDPQFWTD